jgi:hypothetical protein
MGLAWMLINGGESPGLLTLNPTSGLDRAALMVPSSSFPETSQNILIVKVIVMVSFHQGPLLPIQMDPYSYLPHIITIHHQ